MSILNRGSFPERSRATEPEAQADATVAPAIRGDAPQIATRRPDTFDSSGPTPAERCENVLAAGATWEGKLTVDTSVRIDGRFSGAVESKGTVLVANGASVAAEINAAYVVIAGKFSGRIDCDRRVELLATGRIEAEITTRALKVEDGAVLDGRIQMKRDGSPAAYADRSAGATIADLEDEKVGELPPRPSGGLLGA